MRLLHRSAWRLAIQNQTLEALIQVPVRHLPRQPIPAVLLLPRLAVPVQVQVLVQVQPMAAQELVALPQPELGQVLAQPQPALQTVQAEQGLQEQVQDQELVLVQAVLGLVQAVQVLVVQAVAQDQAVALAAAAKSQNLVKEMFSENRAWQRALFLWPKTSVKFKKASRNCILTAGTNP